MAYHSRRWCICSLHLCEMWFIAAYSFLEAVLEPTVYLPLRLVLPYSVNPRNWGVLRFSPALLRFFPAKRPKRHKCVLDSLTLRLNLANRCFKAFLKRIASSNRWKQKRQLSAYRKLYISPFRCLGTTLVTQTSTTQCRYTLAKTGLITPPYGVPVDVRKIFPSSSPPAFNHFLIKRRILLSRIRCLRNFINH